MYFCSTEAAADVFDDSIRFRKQVVQRLALLDPFTEFVGLRADSVVAKSLKLLFFAIDLLDDFSVFADGTVLCRAKNFFNKAKHAGSSL